MYTEEPKRNINFNKLLKKGLTFIGIVFVIILLVWLISKIGGLIKNNNNNVDVNFTDKNENNGSLTNPELYSNEFISGYTYFHDTAKDYFLVNELPKNGSTIKYTLNELINKGLILPFAYKDNASCDLEASYITVKNENGKYTMVTTLVCGREVAKTTEELGCNQLCTNGNCGVVVPSEPTDTELEYQYKQSYQETVTNYTCPSGYTKDGKYCIKNDSSTVKAIKKTTYICPAGYTKYGYGSTTICAKGVENKVKPTEVVNYECADGYTKTGTGNNVSCTKTVNATQITEAKCPTGYSPKGSLCVKTTSVAAKANKETICPSGYSLKNNKCVKTVSTTATPEYNCPDSSYTKTKSGSTYKCTKTSSYTTSREVISYKYSCSTGNLTSNHTCKYTTSSYYVHYTKPMGSSVNGCNLVQTYPDPNCKSFYCSTSVWEYYCPGSTKEVAADKTAVLGCKSGKESGGKCVHTTTDTKNATPSCKEGKLSGNQCVIQKEVSTTPTTKTTYSCPKGELSGTKCIITEEVKPTNNIKYTCKEGKLSDDKCIITDNNKLIKKYTSVCPNGFNKNNGMCVSNGTSTTAYTKKTEYICNSGYTLKGSGSSSVCTKGSVSKIDATKKTSKVTKYRYKWSTETSLEGWERTGLTRQKTTSSK